MGKTVSQLDDNGFFVCPTDADESPLEPGVFILPRGAVDLAPPTVPAGQRAKVVGGVWAFEPIPPEPEPEQPPEPTFEQKKAALFAAFRADRERFIGRLSVIAGRAIRDNDPLKALVCDNLADALLAITTHPSVAAAVDIAALELAMETLYDAAVWAAITSPDAPYLLADFVRMDE